MKTLKGASFYRTNLMMNNPNVFIANGVKRIDEQQKPTITIHKDPVQPGKYIATIEATNCDEIINGYTYDELLSIRNTINEALTAIDVKETVWEFNNTYQKYTQYD